MANTEAAVSTFTNATYIPVSIQTSRMLRVANAIRTVPKSHPPPMARALDSALGGASSRSRRFAPDTVRV
jgi:hypothetical protein